MTYEYIFYANKTFLIFLLVYFFLYLLHVLFIAYANFCVLEGSGSAEKNKKRDIRDRYLINERYREERVEVKNNFARRGDIPILSGDCDGKWVSFEKCFLSIPFY